MKKNILMLTLICLLAAAFTAAADPGSTSEQLGLIADAKDLWKQEEVFGLWGFTVTDLDHNGRLEIISASVQGTGFYTTIRIFEVTEDGTGISEVMQNRPPFDSAPDILVDQATSFYDAAANRYYYIFDDIIRNGMAELYENKRAVSLEDGVWQENILAYKTTVYSDEEHYTVTCTDPSGAEISESQYSSAAQTAFASLKAAELKLNWSMTDDAGFSAVTRESLLAALQSTLAE